MITALALAAGDAGAQRYGDAMPGVDCKAMTSRPGAPMTLAQCEAQFAGARSVQDAMNQPGGDRAGDEQLTCDQILGELQQTAVPGVAPAHAAESQAAGENLKRTYDNAMAEGAAMGAVQSASTGAAAIAATVPGGNAIAGAVTAANMAQQQAAAARNTTAMQAATSRARAANANTMADVAEMYRAHPRLGKLARMASERNCGTSMQPR